MDLFFPINATPYYAAYLLTDYTQFIGVILWVGHSGNVYLEYRINGRCVTLSTYEMYLKKMNYKNDLNDLLV